MSDKLTENQLLAIKCAYADLLGAYEAMEQRDIHAHDWKAHKQSIDDLLNNFKFLED
jgi:hypothetical protein